MLLLAIQQYNMVCINIQHDLVFKIKQHLTQTAKVLIKSWKWKHKLVL